jgi:hypothetical protein
MKIIISLITALYAYLHFGRHWGIIGKISPTKEEVTEVGIMDRLFKGKSHSEVMEDVVHNLQHLSDCELEIAEFYKLCAEKMEEDRGFWEALVKAEVRHSEVIKKMIELVEASPKEYNPGHAFNPAAIRTFKMQIEGMVHDLKAGKTPTDKLFKLADDIEDSAVELSFMKIVDTNNLEFNNLAKQIDTDCVAHKTAIQKKAAGQSD